MTRILIVDDEETIRTADYVVDMGIGAGVHGGEIIAEGTPDELKAGIGADVVTVSVDSSEVVAARQILEAVGDVDGQANDMLRPGAVLGQHREDVFQRLAELHLQLVRDDHLALVPADHAGGEDHPPGRADPVGVALGPRPAGRPCRR